MDENKSWPEAKIAPLKKVGPLTAAEARRELTRLQDCIAADAKRAAEMQKIIDAAPKSLLPDPNCEGHSIKSYMRRCNVSSGIEAQNYADALDTLLMLRHQPGTEAADDDRSQWVIDTADDGSKVGTDFWNGMGGKLRFISPCFRTEADAQAAIDTIGADRILRMFRTLHGVTA